MPCALTAHAGILTTEMVVFICLDCGKCRISFRFSSFLQGSGRTAVFMRKKIAHAGSVRRGKGAADAQSDSILFVSISSQRKHSRAH